MSTIDIVAGAAFIACWLVYEPLMARLIGGPGAINVDMQAVREAWLRRLVARDNRIADSNLIGHHVSSASFFASTNLLIIAAAAGLLFGGERALAQAEDLAVVAHVPVWLFQVKVALVVAMLTFGLLEFIWAIRQLNYTVTLMGAAPERDDVEHHEAFVRAAARVINPAYTAFNRGVRYYYFTLAAAAWLISPWAMLAAAVAAFALLARRQTRSDAALGVREARRILEAMQRRED